MSRRPVLMACCRALMPHPPPSASEQATLSQARGTDEVAARACSPPRWHRNQAPRTHAGALGTAAGRWHAGRARPAPARGDLEPDAERAAIVLRVALSPWVATDAAAAVAGLHAPPANVIVRLCAMAAAAGAAARLAVDVTLPVWPRMRRGLRL